MLYHTLTKQEIYKCSNPWPIKILKVPTNHCVPQSLCLSSDGLFKLSCCYFCWHFGLLSVRSISSCLSFGLRCDFPETPASWDWKKAGGLDDKLLFQSTPIAFLCYFSSHFFLLFLPVSWSTSYLRRKFGSLAALLSILCAILEQHGYCRGMLHYWAAHFQTKKYAILSLTSYLRHPWPF